MACDAIYRATMTVFALLYARKFDPFVIPHQTFKGTGTFNRTFVFECAKLQIELLQTHIPPPF